MRNFVLMVCSGIESEFAKCVGFSFCYSKVVFNCCDYFLGFVE